MKICPVGTKLTNAGVRRDRLTGRTKLIVTFRNFANAPTKHTLSFACNYKTQHEDALANGGKAPRILNTGSIWNW